MKNLQVVVTLKRLDAADTCVYELRAASGEELPAFSAGSHIDVHLPGVVRQYSLCNDPAERHRYLIGVLKDPLSRGGSRALHEHVSQGDLLWISVPRNLFPLVEGAKKSLLLAGGIGITPILAMAETLHRQGADFELHYSCRSRDRAAFTQRLRDSQYADRVSLYFDNEPHAGVLSLAKVVWAAGDDAHLYVCGPGGFINAALSTAVELGWTDERLHSELFVAAPLAAQEESAFDVRLVSSGQRFRVPPDQSIVSVLAENGIEVPVSCEQGICGTCVTRIIDGTPDHRDQCLTNSERALNDRLTLCCSRSKSEVLTLDL